MHAIRDCSFAASVWEVLHPPTPFWGAMNIGDWLQENLRCSRVERGLSWSVIFPFVCFEIWKTRNKYIFESQPLRSPNHIMKSAFIHAQKFANIPPTPQTVTSSPIYSWENIKPPFVHVNVDASFVKIEIKTHVAGLIRNDKGVWIMGFHSCIYASNVLHAELLAIRTGLRVASEANIPYIVLHSDCKQAVDRINSDRLFLDDLSDIVHDCRELRNYFKQVHITFIRRQDNQVADVIAKKHCIRTETSNVVRLIPLIPNYCSELLFSDCTSLFGQTN